VAYADPEKMSLISFIAKAIELPLPLLPYLSVACLSFFHGIKAKKQSGIKIGARNPAPSLC
jgi:hypothetical protein